MARSSKKDENKDEKKLKTFPTKGSAAYTKLISDLREYRHSNPDEEWPTAGEFREEHNRYYDYDTTSYRNRFSAITKQLKSKYIRLFMFQFWFT